MKILLIDNYDSFTYNLVHYVEQVTENPITVVRNDQMNARDAGQFDLIMLSPGPGLPKDAGVMMDVIRMWHQTKHIFGICLGHQAIGEFFGAQLRNLDEVHHGIATPIEVIHENSIFRGIPKTVQVGRYHSWVLDEKTIPDDLVVTAKDLAGEIMAIQHITLPIVGVQFHPESIMTEHGLQMIRNWYAQALPQ